MELQDYRRQYTKGGLRDASMPDHPMVLFEQWQRDASAAGLADPTGVVVATVQPDGSIRQRFVLLKGVSEHGFKIRHDGIGECCHNSVLQDAACCLPINRTAQIWYRT